MPGHHQYYDQRDVSPIGAPSPQFPLPAQDPTAPPPPAHRTPVGVHPASNYNQMQDQRQSGSQHHSDYATSGITPGADNLGEAAAGGGINGIAAGVANMNERESGAQALRDINGWGRSGNGPARPIPGTPSEHSQTGTPGPFGDQYGYASSSTRSIPLASPAPPGYPPYSDSPYNRYSSNLDLAPAQMGVINPNEADDEDDWGMGPHTAQTKRRSVLPFGSSRGGSREGTPGAAAAPGAAVGAGAAAGVMTARDASGFYKPVGQSEEASKNERSEWLASQNTGRKKLTWIVGSVIALVVIGAIVGGVLGAVLNKKGGSSSSSGGGSAQSVADDNKSDLTASSDEIKKLMGNTNLHKVFPGMDYTPLNAQYPNCLTVPPSQNNITRDIAVLSQLTNAVRLYGTDCNQTEMVLTAIDRLQLKDMKVWLGVWLGTNSTTNTRQIAQMWDVLDAHKADPFKGIIVGNEVLYRKDLTEAQLVGNITNIKKNLTSKGIDLPIATSDLGDNWTAEMATQVDIVMSNVHPFFAGVEADQAAGWTWDFWNTHDVALTASNTSIKQIIAEVGWPSGGGNDCGSADCTSTTQGSIAGVDEMNTFMADWVCQSLTNNTEYFWFEAFDEPWKIQYNTKGKEWEDKWGLMDINRKLKSGVKIPDCGGKTAS